MNVLRFLLSILFFLPPILSHAQSSDRFTGSLLWKVSGNGLENPSYILGTHHLMSVSFYDSLVGLKSAFEQSKQVVGEIKVDKMEELQDLFLQHTFLDEDQSYRGLLSEEEYASLDRGLHKIFGTGVEDFKNMKPGMLNTLYLHHIYSLVDPNYASNLNNSIDSYLQKQAFDQGKEVLGLEDFKTQIDVIFYTQSQKDQMLDFICVLNNYSEEDQIESMKLLNEYYQAGKLKEMYDFSFNNPDEPCSPSQSIIDQLLVDRNNKWSTQLPQIMNQSSALIAVGAMHLVEDIGILFQLSQMGYTIEPIQ